MYHAFVSRVGRSGLPPLLAILAGCQVQDPGEQSSTGLSTSEQTTQGSGVTTVSLDGGASAESAATIRLTVVEGEGGAPSWSLAYFTILSTPAAQVTISIRSYSAAMTEA